MKPEVVLLNRWFPPEIFGGTETTIHGLGVALHALGAGVTAVSETRSCPTGWNAVDGIDVYRHPSASVPDRMWPLQPTAMYLNIVRWLERLRPALAGKAFIARTPWYAAAARAAYPKAWITYWAPGSRPCFGLFQGQPSLTCRERWWKWFDERQSSVVRLRALRGANLVVAEAGIVAEDLERRLRIPRARIRVRGNGVDLARFRPRAEDRSLAIELGLDASTPLVVTVARFEPEKNLGFLIRGFGAMRRRDAVLVLVGDGSQRERLQALAGTLGVAERVRFVGWRADVERFYALGRVFVLPSVLEAYGNAFAEALASGTPTIGLRPAPGVFVASRDHIVDGRNGLLVDQDDTAGLAAHLDALIANDDLHGRLSTTARQLAVERYDWRTTASAFLAEITDTHGRNAR